MQNLTNPSNNQTPFMIITNKLKDASQAYNDIPSLQQILADIEIFWNNKDNPLSNREKKYLLEKIKAVYEPIRKFNEEQFNALKDKLNLAMQANKNKDLSKLLEILPAIAEKIQELLNKNTLLSQTKREGLLKIQEYFYEQVKEFNKEQFNALKDKLNLAMQANNNKDLSKLLSIYEKFEEQIKELNSNPFLSKHQKDILLELNKLKTSLDVEIQALKAKKSQEHSQVDIRKRPLISDISLKFIIQKLDDIIYNKDALKGNSQDSQAMDKLDQEIFNNFLSKRHPTLSLISKKPYKY